MATFEPARQHTVITTPKQASEVCRMPSGPRRIRRGPQVFGLSLATSADLLRAWFAPRITGDEKSPRPLSRQDNWHGKSRSQALGLLAPASGAGAAGRGARGRRDDWRWEVSRACAGIVRRTSAARADRRLPPRRLRGSTISGSTLTPKLPFWRQRGACVPHQSIERRFCKPHQQASSRLFFC